MLSLLEWLFDLSLAVGSAAVTGSIFLLLVELAKVVRKHVIHHRQSGATTKHQNAAANTLNANAAN